MKFLVLLSFCFLFLAGYAQNAANEVFKKYAVGNSGCFLYMPGDPGEWKMEKSEDGSEVYTGSVSANGLVFDAIVVSFAEPLAGVSIDDQVTMLISYIDFLKSNFGVESSAGYGKGHKLDGFENANGVIDYWQWADKTQAKIKGWINESNLAVLLVSGSDDPSNKSATEVFLNGFRFPNPTAN